MHLFHAFVDAEAPLWTRRRDCNGCSSKLSPNPGQRAQRWQAQVIASSLLLHIWPCPSPGLSCRPRLTTFFQVLAIGQFATQYVALANGLGRSSTYLVTDPNLPALNKVRSSNFYNPPQSPCCWTKDMLSTRVQICRPASPASSSSSSHSMSRNAAPSPSPHASPNLVGT